MKINREEIKKQLDEAINSITDELMNNHNVDIYITRDRDYETELEKVVGISL